MEALKREFLELLDKDVEFRYAVAGYLGLSEIMKKLDTLIEEQIKLREEQTKIWKEITKLWEEVKNLREGQVKLWEGQNKLWEEVKSLREGQNKLWEEVKLLRVNYERMRKYMLSGFRELRASLGVAFEDHAAAFLEVLLEEMGYLDAKVGRKILAYNGEAVEINLFCEEPLIVGETTVSVEESEMQNARFMNLSSFKYLRWQRTLTLTLIITLSSMLFSLTALSLLGFYRGFSTYLGEGEDIVAVYDRRSRTPFTGLVPAYLAEKIGALNGVLASSPEAIAPCIVRGEAIFLRGIMPEGFTNLSQITMIEGGMLEIDDLNHAIVSRKLAERLSLKLNDKVLVLGVLTDRYVELQVKGIFVSNSPIDDEILAPLYVGQWLRGADYGHVTLIRFKIDRSAITPFQILEEIAKEASEPSQPPSASPGQPQPPSITPRIIARFKTGDLGVEEAYNFMRSYMDRYGLTRESLLILSVMVFLLSGASIVAASKTIIAQHKGEINVLRSIGASKRLLKRDMLVKLLPWSMAASSLGFAMAAAVLTVIQGSGYMQVLSHAAPLSIDPLVVILNFIIVILLVSISILRGKLE